MHKEGEVERIDHWVNKMWKLGGEVHTKIENKLKFLYENGRQEQVGMYLRNQNILDELFWELYKKRVECEKVHGHMKDTMNFDVRRIRVESRALYSLLNFVSYQLLVFTELQNKVKLRNSFGRLF